MVGVALAAGCPSTLDTGFLDPALEVGLVEAAREAGLETLDAGLAAVLETGLAEATETGLAAAWDAGLEEGALAFDAGLTFFSAGSSVSSSAPFASSSALRFFPRGALGFSSLSAPSLSAFFALGFAGAFLGAAASSFGCSLIREERRGSVAGSPDTAVEFAALRGIVEGGSRFGE